MFFKDLLIYYVYNILPACMPARQSRAPDLSTDGCEPSCGCRDSNSVRTFGRTDSALTAEPSLQPLFCFLRQGLPISSQCFGTHCPETSSVDQTGLELTEIYPSSGIKGVNHHAWPAAKHFFFKGYRSVVNLITSLHRAFDSIPCTIL